MIGPAKGSMRGETPWDPGDLVHQKSDAKSGKIPRR